jgi:hypothetical protein
MWRPLSRRACVPGEGGVGIEPYNGRCRIHGDRLQQGLLNALYLGRLMIHPNGLKSDPAFHVHPQDAASAPVIDASQLY